MRSIFNIYDRFYLKGLCFIVFAGLLLSCTNDEEESVPTFMGNWERKSDFEGVKRSGAVVFTIGDFAYVGTGFDGSKRLKDFWQYDKAKNTWFRKADLPGPARNAAVAFSANGKGYVGTGYDGENRLNDFWEYDPATNEWSAIPDFAGTARMGAVAFSLQDKGYVSSGSDGNDLKDLWQYDPVTKAWNQKISLGGAKRTNAFAFVVDEKAYLGGGRNNGIFETDFWEYDGSADEWVRKKDLDTNGHPIAREYAVTFSTGTHGYLATGSYGGLRSDIWEYDPGKDQWRQMRSFSGTSRETAVGFGLGNRGYITTGRNAAMRFDDLWEFENKISDNQEAEK